MPHRVGPFFFSPLSTRMRSTRTLEQNDAHLTGWLPCDNILELENIFLAINTGENHWILGHVDVKNESTQAYDTMGVCRSDWGVTLVELVQEMVKIYPPVEAAPWDRDDLLRWMGRAPGESFFVPHQGNGYDCGVYVCLMANLLDSGHSLAVLKAGHEKAIRERLSFEILDDNLMK